MDADDIIIPPILNPVKLDGAVVWSEAIGGITMVLFPHLIPTPVFFENVEGELQPITLEMEEVR